MTPSRIIEPTNRRTPAMGPTSSASINVETLQSSDQIQLPFDSNGNRIQCCSAIEHCFERTDRDINNGCYTVTDHQGRNLATVRETSNVAMSAMLRLEDSRNRSPQTLEEFSRSSGASPRKRSVRFLFCTRKREADRSLRKTPHHRSCGV